MVAQECLIVPEWDNANPPYCIFAPVFMSLAKKMHFLENRGPHRKQSTERSGGLIIFAWGERRHKSPVN